MGFSCLLAQSDANILHGSVLGHRGHEVITTRGDFEAEILIDATGWRAALATNARQQAQPRRGMSFGLETAIPEPGRGLHFYYEPRRLRPFNVGWLFPTGARGRIGLGRAPFFHTWPRARRSGACSNLPAGEKPSRP